MTLKRTSLNHLIWAPKSRLVFGDVAVAVVGWDFDGEAMSGSARSRVLALLVSDGFFGITPEGERPCRGLNAPLSVNSKSFSSVAVS